MVTIKHNKTNKIEVVSIGVWVNRMSHNKNVWTAVKIEDIVDLYQFSFGMWRYKRKSERKDAEDEVHLLPNVYMFIPSLLNTIISHEDKEIIKKWEHHPLLERLPAHSPKKYAPITHTATNQKDTFAKKKAINVFINAIVYPVIALIIRSIILKLMNII